MDHGDGTGRRAPTDALTDAAALGVPAMAALVSSAPVGVVVVDDHHHYVYANPAACRMLGRTADQLRDMDLFDSFPAQDHAAVLAGFVSSSAGEAATFSGVLTGADGREREVVCSTFGVTIDDRRHGVAVIWDVTASRQTDRTALALAQTAARMTGTGSTSDILTELARHAVEGSGALSCGISVVAANHTLEAAGAYGPPGPGYGEGNPAWKALADTPVESVIEAMTDGMITFADPPGRPAIVPDARAVWESDPITRPFAENLKDLDWRGGVYLPLAWEEQIVGVLAMFLPATMSGPSEADLALYRALADQAAVVVMTGRFAERAATTAALLERSRLARELHDSVSQSLFSMTMHARAAQLSLAPAGFDAADAIGGSVARLADLTRGALAEMRGLIFELRPGALTEEGLVSALRRKCAALTDGEPVLMTLLGPTGRLDLLPETEEHAYRIAVEAMTNVVKHAGAASASVSIASAPDALTLTVVDDGGGFDVEESRLDGHGLSAMIDRARSVGGELVITSAVGSGTTVRCTLPVDGPSDG